MIEIPEKLLLQELGWFRLGMGERAVRVFLLHHLSIIDEGLTVENFVGLDLWFGSSQEVDMVFRRDKTYYLVETKQKAKYHKACEQLIAAVPVFESEMKKNSTELKEVVAVLATSSTGSVPELKVTQHKWFGEQLED
jgi:hypothetical protein